MKDTDLDWMRLSKQSCRSGSESMSGAALAAICTISDRLPKLLGATDETLDDRWTELSVRTEVPRRMPGARAFDASYRIGDKLGGGKFGNVFQGTRVIDQKPVAIKVCRPLAPT